MDSANSTAHHPQQYHRHVHELLVKIFCKLENTFHLSVRNEKPVMAPSNSNDPTQVIMMMMILFFFSQFFQTLPLILR